MSSFIKLLIIIIIAIGLIFFFVSSQGGNFFQSGPKEKVVKTSQEGGSSSKNSGFFNWRDIIPGDYSSKQTAISPQAEKKEILDSQIPSGFTREQLSPYFQKITVSSVSPNRSQSISSYSTIRLSSGISGEEIINITGWKIKSNRKEIIIPQAVGIYSPLNWEPETDIILSKGNYVYIYSNKSAFNRNLRLNKCVGFLENIYDFIPSLPQNCPSISRSEYNYLSGECQSYILSLRGCELPKVSFSNSLPGTSEGNACREFLNTISHGSCFKKYRNDSDFFSNEWRVWINADILDSQHDRILLYDKIGLLVDEYSY
ncbi:MAG: hypothetical protein AAB516_02365 [Patescibacteria group bacterium]